MSRGMTDLYSNFPTEAVIKSWDATFRGNAADVLLMSISTSFDRLSDDVYARFSSIVNSAGTGKSRMVDQVATKVVTIPMCLRGEAQRIQGFPPADNALRNWLYTLNNTMDRGRLAMKVHGFLLSLFTVTSTRLKELLSKPRSQRMPLRPDIPASNTKGTNMRDELETRQESLAQAFRDRMTCEQTFYFPNEYRRTFFQDVVDAADEFTRVRQESVGIDAASDRTRAMGVQVRQAAKELFRPLDPKGASGLTFWATATTPHFGF